MNKKKTKTPDTDFRQQEEIFGILLMTLALLIFFSLITYDPGEEPSGLNLLPVKNAMGVVGVYISYYLIKMFIGYSSIVLPFVLLAWGWNRFRGSETTKLIRITIFVFVIAVYIATILGIPQAANPESFRYGFDFSGLLGGFLATVLYKFFGTVGSTIILISIAMISIVAATQVSFERMIAAVFDTIFFFFNWCKKQIQRISIPKMPHFSMPNSGTDEPAQPKIPQQENQIRHSEKIPLQERLKMLAQREQQEQKPVPPQVNFQRPMSLDEQPAAPDEADLFDEEITVTEREDLDEPRSDSELPPAPARGEYLFPGVDLLDFPVEQSMPVAKEELLSNAKILEERLAEFGVEGNVVEINPGPVITRYEIEPAPGIKVSKITALADDLALSMRAKRIRIIAPIPGKAAVGIELPNRHPQVVYLRSLIDDTQFRDSESPLTLALGKTISGKPYITELDKMPHMLIAGSTGSGKSICINAILASILYKAHPTDVQFVLIDPKRLELSLYAQLHNHHLSYREDLNEVVFTTPQNALTVLRSLEYEMELRYDLLASAGVRNIKDYNQRVKDGRITGTDQNPALPLPHIVLIIDELADLMLTAAKEVEEPIARLTQMARAVGMHLIVATQRPSVDVITGVIKANFPARIAFAVASKIDSRTILDMNGAEKLLGKGDMLFVPPGSPEAIRIHGAFVSTDEVEKILAHIQLQPRYPRKLLPVRDEEITSIEGGASMIEERDVLFNEALKIVVRHQQGSISLLQRRLKVGYARAARIIDELEAAGVVGAFDGSKAREVLLSDDDLEQLDWNMI
ncbi:MAG: DNA translocase FtsK [Calditrichaeota bacterium]|nr:MAG: DNA translocase FtsK [Calditrichota bacterium]